MVGGQLWAYATLAQQPGAHFLETSGQRAIELLPSFCPQHLANTMWSLATLHAPHSLDVRLSNPCLAVA